MELPDSSILTNIYIPGYTKPSEQLFEKKYITISSMEGRLYSDEELMQLPDIQPSHPHYREWLLRKCSMQRLSRWVAAKKKSLEILEIGCGNGWLSHHLAGIPGSKVVGLDINFTELQQAARIFNDEPNLRFVQGDLSVLGHQTFDLIVFAASVQYFSSLRKILYACLFMLNPGGEIHILDSPFYRPAEINREKMKTAAYFASLGYPEMAEMYHHHTLEGLGSFHHKLLFNPNAVGSRLLRKKGNFPWICVRNDF